MIVAFLLGNLEQKFLFYHTHISPTNILKLTQLTKVQLYCKLSNNNNFPKQAVNRKNSEAQLVLHLTLFKNYLHYALVTPRNFEASLTILLEGKYNIKQYTLALYNW